MAQVGNKINSCLNGEWAKHVRWFGKRMTAGIRRMQGKEVIHEEVSAMDYSEEQKIYDIYEYDYADLLLRTEKEISLVTDERKFSIGNFPLRELLKNAA